MEGRKEDQDIGLKNLLDSTLLHIDNSSLDRPAMPDHWYNRKEVSLKNAWGAVKCNNQSPLFFKKKTIPSFTQVDKVLMLGSQSDWRWNNC